MWPTRKLNGSIVPALKNLEVPLSLFQKLDDSMKPLETPLTPAPIHKMPKCLINLYWMCQKLTGSRKNHYLKIDRFG